MEDADPFCRVFSMYSSVCSENKEGLTLLHAAGRRELQITPSFLGNSQRGGKHENPFPFPESFSQNLVISWGKASTKSAKLATFRRGLYPLREKISQSG